jgi:CRP-like cAMP-binding protein
MENKLIAYFSKFASFSESEKNAINEGMVVKKYKKNDFLLKEGQANADTFFVMKGLVRQYKIVEGEEITTNFYTEGQWIISLTSFIAEKTSTDYLECIEDTELVTGNEDAAQKIFKAFPHFETVSRAVMESVFLEQQVHMTAFLTDTPEQRYSNLLQNKPDLFQRVPQYQIASYLGVKPESLSRIRKRIISKH